MWIREAVAGAIVLACSWNGDRRACGGGGEFILRATAADHIYSESDVPTAPVALVLGAKVFPDGTPSPFLTARLDLAKRLYDAGRVEVIIVSGDNDGPEYDEPADARLFDQGWGARIEADH